MGIWEVLRRYRRAASAARLAELCQCSLAEAQQSLDLLERATLVRKRRASRGRRSAVYETAVASISVIFDRGDPGEARIFRSLEQFVTRELEDKHFEHEIPITSAPAGHWSYYHCNPMFLEAADIEELRRRIARVEEFVSLLNDRQSESMTVQSCNHVMAIRVSPLGGAVMPQPHVRLVGRKIAEAPRRAVDAAVAPRTRGRPRAARRKDQGCGREAPWDLGVHAGHALQARLPQARHQPGVAASGHRDRLGSV